jgi:hypothetical protein
LLVVLVLLTAHVAGAEPATDDSSAARAPGDSPSSETDWNRNPFLLEAHLGVATPVGVFGGMLEYSPIENFSLACGAGTNGYGLQTACMARARSFFSPGRTGYFAAGASMGPHKQTESTNLGLLSALIAPFAAGSHGKADEAEYVWEQAIWANFEVGLEMRSGGGSFRPYFGIAWMQNFDDGERKSDQELMYEDRRLADANAVMPYGGLAVGGSF